MNSLARDVLVPLAVTAEVTEDGLVVELSDGRAITAPLAWFPRLLHGTAAERRNLRLIGRGEGLHWPDLDEDISVEALIAGRGSSEGAASLANWLKARPVKNP